MNTVRQDLYFSLIPSAWKPHFNGFAKCSIHPVILNHIFLVSISLWRSQYLSLCYWRVVVCCADAEPGTCYAAYCVVQPRGRTQRPHLLPALRPAVPASPGDGLAPEGYLYLTHVLFYFFLLMFRIHDIFVWIWIRNRGSMPLTNGSWFGAGSCYFRHWPPRRLQKPNLKKNFSAYYFLKVR